MLAMEEIPLHVTSEFRTDLIIKTMQLVAASESDIESWCSVLLQSYVYWMCIDGTCVFVLVLCRQWVFWMWVDRAFSLVFCEFLWGSLGVLTAFFFLLSTSSFGGHVVSAASSQITPQLSQVNHCWLILCISKFSCVKCMLFDLNLKVLSLKFLISSASSSMVAKQVRQKVHNDRSGMHTKEEWGKRYVSWWWLGGGGG